MNTNSSNQPGAPPTPTNANPEPAPTPPSPFPQAKGESDRAFEAFRAYLPAFLTDDLGQMTFGDACKALEVASRLGQQVVRAEAEADTLSAAARALSADPMTLFHRAFPETQTPTTPGDEPQH